MKNLVVLLLVALFFVGCSQKAPSKKDEISIMVSYFELGGEKQQLLIKSMPNLADKNASVPFFGMVNFLDQNKTTSAYSLVKGVINVVEADSASINLNKASDVLALKKSSEIEFYEIRHDVVESVKFSSQNGVCGEFLAQKPVFVQAATNYYLKDDSFFASFIEAKFVYKKGAKILKKEFAYNISEPKILDEAKEFTQKPNQLFLNDMQKLGRLLDILCTF
jgi:putative lipoprotein